MNDRKSRIAAVACSRWLIVAAIAHENRRTSWRPNRRRRKTERGRHGQNQVGIPFGAGAVSVAVNSAVEFQRLEIAAQGSRLDGIGAPNHVAARTSPTAVA